MRTKLQQLAGVIRSGEKQYDPEILQALSDFEDAVANDKALIMSALSNSKPIMSHYPETVERHAAAINALDALC